MTTGQKIRVIRQGRKMTQWQLSQAVGITPGALLLIERGNRDCPPALMAELAKALQVQSGDLVSDDG